MAPGVEGICHAIAQAYGLRRTSDRWRGPCPVHGGTGEAFVLREREDGYPLVYCHAGCEFREILSELRSHGLWPDADEQAKEAWRERKRAEDVAHARLIVIIAHEATSYIADRFGPDYRWARKVLSNAGYRVRRVSARQRRFDGQIVEIEAK